MSNRNSLIHIKTAVAAAGCQAILGPLLPLGLIETVVVSLTSSFYAKLGLFIPLRKGEVRNL